MQPQNTQLPPIQPGGPSPWGYGDLPSVDPGSNRRKKILIVACAILGALVLLAIIAIVAGNSTSKRGSGDYVMSSAQTSVELIDHDNQVFTMRFPKGLNVLTSEALEEDRIGWFLNLQQSAENSDYDVSVVVSNAAPEYTNGEEAVNELVDEGDLTNIRTSDVIMAGTNSKKTTADFTKDEQVYTITYSYAQVGERHIEFTAIYDKKRAEITDSLDVILGSIKLK
jgi:hypothetical protein